MAGMGMAASTTAALAAVAERTLLCSDGVRLAARHWPPASPTTPGRKILCLHGWLDNAASFHLLAPDLSQRLAGDEIVAVDLPGHGLSSHKSPDGPTQLLAEYAYYVSETLEALHWDSVSLVGHSMGAGVSVLYAASFPEKVDSLVLLDGMGPLARNAADCTKHVRKACERRMRSNRTLYPGLGAGFGGDRKLKNSGNRVYPTLNDAVETRINTAKLSPGNQHLSREAAHAMVSRATVSAEDGPSPDAVTFRHDPRLQWPSLQYFTREQVEAMLRDVQCPVCLLIAENGWPIDEKVRKLAVDMLQPMVFKTLKGSHHFHADPDTANEVIDEIVKFLQDRS